jgi:ribosomal protein L11 methyltransferase
VPAALIRLAVRVPRAEAEIVLAELLELVPAGCEEVELPDGLVEFALYGAPGELPALPRLQAIAGGGTVVEIDTREVAGDWAERWRSFHQPVRVTAPVGSGLPDLRVRPPWEPAIADGGIDEIVIDPGQAFGTGAHATTRLCLQLLLELAASAPPAHGALLDVGCGSGVLAIAAARLGFDPVVAVDQSVTACAENAAVNGVSLVVSRLDLRRDRLPVAGVVLANLLRPLLLELADALPTAPAELIAGGMLVGEEDEVAARCARALGLREHARLREGDWASLWLRR